MALLVHVLTLELLQNYNVTFDLILSFFFFFFLFFFDRHYKISLLFYEPEKFAANFCGFGELYVNMCLHFPAKNVRTDQRADRRIKSALGSTILERKFVLSRVSLVTDYLT